jgi:hypothetical protein
VAMLDKYFGRLMRNERFKKKFFKKMIRADCGNLKQGKGKAYNVTLSDESEEERSS